MKSAGAGTAWIAGPPVACCLAAALATAALLPGCRCADGPPAGAAPPASVSASASAAQPVVLLPLAGPALQELPLGTGRAEVSVPVGATSASPLVVVLRGSSEDALDRCAVWRDIAGPAPFVLALPRPAGPSSPDAADPASAIGEGVERALRAALEALKRTYTAHVGAGPIVLVGVRESAGDAIRIARQEPAFFARLVLVEGGAEAWSAGVAAVYARGGGKGVVFACRSARCEAAAGLHLHPAGVAGLDATVLVAGGGDADVELRRRLREAWPRWFAGRAHAPGGGAASSEQPGASAAPPRARPPAR